MSCECRSAKGWVESALLLALAKDLKEAKDAQADLVIPGESHEDFGGSGFGDGISPDWPEGSAGWDELKVVCG